LKAEIYSYSRSRGLFAGVSLQGAALLVDYEGNAAFYGLRGGHPADVLACPRATAVAVEQLREQLNRMSGAPAAPPVIVVPPPLVPVSPPPPAKP
jgi:lipid-binding SYLF domain-containing protein